MQTQADRDKAAAADARADRGPGDAGRDPLGRVPRLPARAGRRRWPSETLRDVPRGRLHQRPADGGARPATRRSTARSRPRGLADRDALRPLRRPASPARAGLDDRPVDPDPQGRRADLRARRRRRQGRPGRPTSARCRSSTGKPPCTVKLIVEGMEETECNLEAFVEATPTCSTATCSSSATWATSRSASRADHHPTRRRRLHRHRAHPRSTRCTRASSAAPPRTR